MIDAFLHGFTAYLHMIAWIIGFFVCAVACILIGSGICWLLCKVLNVKPTTQTNERKH